MKKIIIVGGGLSGLAAGIRLLEMDKNLKVIIYNMGHHLGGKASSYRDEKGYNIDHGFHAIFEHYGLLLHLLKRSGVPKSDLKSNKGKGYYYEDDSGKIHTVGALFDRNNFRYLFKPGYGFAENMVHINYFIRNYYTMMFEKNIENLDDICYTAWALKNGLTEKIIRKRVFRFSLDALFNWPYEVSTYITFKSLRLLSGSSKFYMPKGNYGETLINPIVEYFKKLGGEIILYKKLTKVEYQNNRLTGLTFESPDSTIHKNGTKHWDREVITIPSSSETVNDFKYSILTLPVDNFRELNKNDMEFWKHYPGITNLTSIATLSWQMWTKGRAMPRLSSAINGLDEPMGMVIDYKHIVPEYKNNPEIGSALEWVGQETGYEKYSDEELKEIILSSFLKIPYTTDPRKAGIIYESFNRNTSNNERYLLTDPGTLKFRPKCETQFTNMFLAGDWIRNHVDVPTMEGAVCSGYSAADKILKSIQNELQK